MLRNFYARIITTIIISIVFNCIAQAETLITFSNDESFVSFQNEELTGLDKLRNPLSYSCYSWPNDELINANAITEKKHYKYEIDRTWHWFSIIISPSYLPIEAKNHLILLPNMKNGDDWIILRYQFKDLKIQIIDGREMTILVKPVDSKSLWLVSSKSTTDKVSFLLNKLLYHDCYGGETKMQVKNLKPKESTELGEYGIVTIDRKETGWLINNSITWWSDGESFLLSIKKQLNPPMSKYPLEGSLYIGSIPLDDKRKYIRFNKNKCINFNDEFNKMSSKNSGQVAMNNNSTKELKNRALRSNSKTAEFNSSFQELLLSHIETRKRIVDIAIISLEEELSKSPGNRSQAKISYLISFMGDIRASEASEILSKYPVQSEHALIGIGIPAIPFLLERLHNINDPSLMDINEVQSITKVFYESLGYNLAKSLLENQKDKTDGVMKAIEQLEVLQTDTIDIQNKSNNLTNKETNSNHKEPDAENKLRD